MVYHAKPRECLLHLLKIAMVRERIEWGRPTEEWGFLPAPSVQTNAFFVCLTIYLCVREYNFTHPRTRIISFTKVDCSHFKDVSS